MPVSDNPYRQAALGEGWTSELLDALPTPDLVEHVRFLHHESRHDSDAYSRWWRSKQFSEGRRALVRRGLSADAWVPTVGDR